MFAYFLEMAVQRLKKDLNVDITKRGVAMKDITFAGTITIEFNITVEDYHSLLRQNSNLAMIPKIVQIGATKTASLPK